METKMVKKILLLSNTSDEGRPLYEIYLCIKFISIQKTLEEGRSYIRFLILIGISEELTHWKRLWCWEGLGAGEGDDRGWDGWMASPTWWTWVCVNSGSWWWTGRPGMLQFMGSQRVGHDWMTELNWTECPNFILLHAAVQFSQHHLLKRLFFLHYIFLPPLS